MLRFAAQLGGFELPSAEIIEATLTLADDETELGADPDSDTPEPSEPTGPPEETENPAATVDPPERPEHSEHI